MDNSVVSIVDGKGMRVTHPYRAIAFDAVGTLIYPQPSVTEIYHTVGLRHGSRLAREEVGTRFRKAFRASELRDLQDADGGLTHAARERARWREIVVRIFDDLPDPEPCFEELYAHFARPAAWRCFDDVAETLRTLAAAGYPLWIASNFDERLEPVRVGLPELAPITGCVISGNIGHRKPSPGFYAALCAAAECLPHELLMIGDDEENDVTGARASGVAALFLRRGEQAPVGGLATLAELPRWLG